MIRQEIPGQQLLPLRPWQTGLQLAVSLSSMTNSKEHLLTICCCSAARAFPWYQIPGQKYKGENNSHKVIYYVAALKMDSNSIKSPTADPLYHLLTSLVVTPECDTG